MRLFTLGITFFCLSFLVIGGGNAFIDTLAHSMIQEHQWLTANEFKEIYSLGQLAPGPNMLSVILIGYKLQGIPGAFVVLFAFLLPDTLLVFIANRLWHAYVATTFADLIRKTFAPIAVGLMFAGVYSLAKISFINLHLVYFAIVTILLVATVRINPFLVILGSGLLGLLFF